MSTTGIVLLAHGSRGEKIEGARVKELVELLRGRMSNGDIVQPAFLQFNQPDLEQAITSLVTAGTTDIVVLPYFLFEGAHYNQHIPAELQRIETKYPGVNIRMTRGLGVDHRLIDILEARLRETRNNGKPAAGNAISPIEEMSYQRITALYPELDDSPEGLVRKRVLHATANPELASGLRFHADAVNRGLAALRSGAPLIVDVRMASVGINRNLSGSLGCPIFCAIEEADSVIASTAKQSPGSAVIASAAKQSPGGNAGDCFVAPTSRGLLAMTGPCPDELGTPRNDAFAPTRSATGMARLAARFPGAIIAVGNAPTALMAVLDLIKNEAPPALVIGVPVGFISAAESKERLMASPSSVPYISLPGRQGGSAVAVAIINALLRMAS